jgi:hypothetical protein
MITRISIGWFDPSRSEEVATMLHESEKSLRPAISKLKGNKYYFVGLDRQKGAMTNTSIWETLEDAQQMATLPEMLALRERFEALNITFNPITNHEELWVIE